MQKLFKFILVLSFLVSPNLWSSDNPADSIHPFPEGQFRGWVSSTGNARLSCEISRVDLRIKKQDDHSIRLFWEESGRTQNGDYCYIDFGARLTPAGDGLWNVRFNRLSTASRALLRFDGSELSLDTRIYVGNSVIDFGFQWTLMDDGETIYYNREFQDFGKWVRASGRIFLVGGETGQDISLH